MFEIVMLVHLAALVFVNVVDKDANPGTWSNKYYWVIEYVAGLFTSLVRK